MKESEQENNEVDSSKAISRREALKRMAQYGAAALGVAIVSSCRLYYDDYYSDYYYYSNYYSDYYSNYYSDYYYNYYSNYNY